MKSSDDQEIKNRKLSQVGNSNNFIIEEELTNGKKIEI